MSIIVGTKCQNNKLDNPVFSLNSKQKALENIPLEIVY